MKQYPLFDNYIHCPSARYVGGTSKYLCECPVPEECPGVDIQDAYDLYTNDIPDGRIRKQRKARQGMVVDSRSVFTIQRLQQERAK